MSVHQQQSQSSIAPLAFQIPPTKPSKCATYLPPRQRLLREPTTLWGRARRLKRGKSALKQYGSGRAPSRKVRLAAMSTCPLHSRLPLPALLPLTTHRQASRAYPCPLKTCLTWQARPQLPARPCWPMRQWQRLIAPLWRGCGRRALSSQDAPIWWNSLFRAWVSIRITARQ